MSGSKDCCVVVVDINANLASTMVGSNSAFDLIKESVRLLVQQRIMWTKQDEIGIVTVGDSVTHNNLNREETQYYRNVNVVHNVAKPSLSTLAVVDSLDTHSLSSVGDVIDGLLVAMEMIISRVKKLKFSKHIYIFTDGSGPIVSDATAFRRIEEALSRENIKINVIGIGFNEDEDEPEEGKPYAEEERKEHKGGEGEGEGEGEKGEIRVKVKKEPSSLLRSPSLSHRSSLQLENEAILREVCANVGGIVVSIQSALKILSMFRSKTVNQITKYRGPMEIGDVAIPIYSYAKTMVVPFPSMKKFFQSGQTEDNGAAAAAEMDDDERVDPGEGGGGGFSFGGREAFPTTGDVKMERTYKNKLGDKEEVVDPSMLMRSFRYGKQWVPVSDEEIAAMKLESEKCLKVLTFVDERVVKRYQYMATSDCIVAEPGNFDAAVALSAFIHAMFETQRVAIVRYVKRKNAAPLLGVLVPEITTAYECLYFNQLPFAEDARDFSFASLSSVSAFVPSPEQVQVAKDLVNNMSLMDAFVDESGAREEALNPIMTFNPTLQHFYQIVQRRAQDSSTEVGELDPRIASYVHPDDSLMNGAKPWIEKFRQSFPMTVIPKTEKGEKKHWRDYYDAGIMMDEDIEIAKRIRIEMEKKESGIGKGNDQPGDASLSSSPSPTLTLSDLAPRNVSIISSSDPIGDFRLMIARRDDPNIITKAMAQMQKIIVDTVTNSYQQTLYSRAIESLIELRKASVQFEESENFNGFIRTLKSLLPTKKREDFISLMQSKGILPIDNTEVYDSPVSPETAKNFYGSEVARPPPQPKPQQSADDIFESLE